MTLTKKKFNKFEEVARDEFKRIGIIHFPDYREAKDYFQRIKRCSILTSENLEYFSTSSATEKRKIPSGN